jgi:hypothetical protein
LHVENDSAASQLLPFRLCLERRAPWQCEYVEPFLFVTIEFFGPSLQAVRVPVCHDTTGPAAARPLRVYRVDAQTGQRIPGEAVLATGSFCSGLLHMQSMTLDALALLVSE